MCLTDTSLATQCQKATRLTCPIKYVRSHSVEIPCGPGMTYPTHSKTVESEPRDHVYSHPAKLPIPPARHRAAQLQPLQIQRQKRLQANRRQIRRLRDQHRPPSAIAPMIEQLEQLLSCPVRRRDAVQVVQNQKRRIAHMLEQQCKRQIAAARCIHRRAQPIQQVSYDEIQRRTTLSNPPVRHLRRQPCPSRSCRPSHQQPARLVIPLVGKLGDGLAWTTRSFVFRQSRIR